MDKKKKHFLHRHTTANNRPLKYSFSLLFVILPFVGFFLGTRYQALLDKPLKTKPSVIVPTPTPTPPADLSLLNKVTFSKCGVTFHLPPKTTADRNAAYWGAPRGSIYPEVLGLAQKNGTVREQMNAIFAADNATKGGYVPGAVSVTCQSNPVRLDRDAFLTALKKGIEEYNRMPGEKGMGPVTYKIDKTATVSKWGREATLITMNGEEFYMLFTPQKIYEIRMYVQSPNMAVRNAASQIMDRLTFE